MVHAARVARIPSSVVMTSEDSDDDPGSGVQRVQYLRQFRIGLRYRERVRVRVRDTVRNRVRSKLGHVQH